MTRYIARASKPRFSASPNRSFSTSSREASQEKASQHGSSSAKLASPASRMSERLNIERALRIPGPRLRASTIKAHQRKQRFTNDQTPANHSPALLRRTYAP